MCISGIKENAIIQTNCSQLELVQSLAVVVPMGAL